MRANAKKLYTGGSRARRSVVEQLVVVVTRHDPAFDLRVDRVGAPAAIPQTLIEADRSLLRVAQIEVEDGQPQFPAEPLNLQHDAAAEAVAAGPRRHERARQGTGEGLRFVVARGAAELRRAGHDPLQAADDEPALRYQQHALPIIFQDLTRRRLQPAESPTLGDSALGRLAKILEIVT